MAIITPAIWQSWSNIQVAGGELTSLQAICNQVDRSVKNRLKRTLETQTFSNLIFDAPDTPNIELGRYAPITIAGFQCWYNDLAQGNPTCFGTDSLLTMYTDYVLDTDPDDPSLSPGNLRRVSPGIGGSSLWGISYRWRPAQMAPQFDPNFGAVMLTFVGGYTPDNIPDDIVEACCIAISKIQGVRKYGMQVGSESLTGYSYNLPGVGMMINGLLGNPDIRGLLEPYVNYADIIG